MKKYLPKNKNLIFSNPGTRRCTTTCLAMRMSWSCGRETSLMWWRSAMMAGLLVRWTDINQVIEIEIQNALSQTHDELKVSLSLKCIKWYNYIVTLACLFYKCIKSNQPVMWQHLNECRHVVMIRRTWWKFTGFFPNNHLCRTAWKLENGQTVSN